MTGQPAASQLSQSLQKSYTQHSWRDLRTVRAVVTDRMLIASERRLRPCGVLEFVVPLGLLT